jgi:ATP-dependent protease HslVU (ClpYQ) ATPase subunit
MEDISFLAPSLRGQTKVIDATYVKERLSKLKSNIDLAKFLI